MLAPCCFARIKDLASRATEETPQEEPFLSTAENCVPGLWLPGESWLESLSWNNGVPIASHLGVSGHSQLSLGYGNACILLSPYWRGREPPQLRAAPEHLDFYLYERHPSQLPKTDKLDSCPVLQKVR